jgi:hypothetical protein
VFAVAAALTACQTGERPSFDASSDRSPADRDTAPAVEAATAHTPDNAGSAASERPGMPAALFITSGAAETATYEVRQSSQGVTAVVTVSREPGRTVVEVRGTQFREEDGERQTCNVDTNVCEPEFAEQRLSDLQISTGFWGPAVRRELESPTLDARIGPLEYEPDTYAGQTATCVVVPGPSRTDRYCALPSGLLAAKATAAVSIELVDYHTGFDEALWAKIPA